MKKFGIKVYLRIFASSWLLSVVFLGGAGVMGQGRLELEPSEAPGVAENFYRLRLQGVEMAIAGKGAEQESGQRPGKLVSGAQKNLRVVARELWRIAQARESHVAGLYAMTIERGAGGFDAMTNRLADEAAEMLPPESVADAERLAALVRAGEALEEFNRLSGEVVVEAGDVDAYLREVLGPLKAVEEVMKERGVVAELLGGDEDEETQAVGDERTERLQAVTSLIAGLGEGRSGSLMRLVEVASKRMLAPGTRENGEMLLAYAEELGAVSEARRSMPVMELPVDLRRVRRQVEANFDSAEGRLYGELGALAEKPEDVTSPRWGQPLNELKGMLRVMVYVDRVPDWIERMGRFNPQTSRGLYQQMKRIAEDLLEPAMSGGAALALGEMQNQLALFERMPGEEALGQRQSWMEQLTGNRSMAILQQITILRSQWAAAWATGADPTAPGNKLLAIRRVLQLMNEAEAGDLGERLQKLNELKEWEIELKVIDATMAELPMRIGQAAELIVGAKWGELAMLMDEVDAKMAVARLAPAAPPPGAEGRMGVEQREAAAELCVYLAAGDWARESGDQRTADAMMEYAGQLAGRIAGE